MSETTQQKRPFTPKGVKPRQKPQSEPNNLAYFTRLRLSKNVYTHYYNADVIPVDQLIVPVDDIRTEDNVNFTAVLIYIWNINQTQKTHRVEVGFKLQASGFPNFSTARYLQQ